MASKKTIVQQIEHSIQDEHGAWSIGVTPDPAARKAGLGNPLSWLQWQADSEDAASDILNDLVQSGVNRSGPAGQTGTFVYIFRSA